MNAPGREDKPGTELAGDWLAAKGEAAFGDVADASAPEAADWVSAMGDLVIEAEAPETSSGEAAFKGVAARPGCIGGGSTSLRLRIPEFVACRSASCLHQYFFFEVCHFGESSSPSSKAFTPEASLRSQQLAGGE